MSKVPMARCKILLVWALAAWFAAASMAIAQQAPAQKPDDQQPAETLKLNVNVVQLFFNVKDKHGALIPNLTKDAFEVFEDSKPQTIKYFTAESNLPLTLGMMIDSSGSQTNVIDMEKQVGGALLRMKRT